jgi:hypothetical protein
MQLIKQPAYAATEMSSGLKPFCAIPRHDRSTSFKALNLHFTRQLPQAAHLPGYFTAACIPVSSSTVSNTWWEHLWTQRRQPAHLLSIT